MKKIKLTKVLDEPRRYFVFINGEPKMRIDQNPFNEENFIVSNLDNHSRIASIRFNTVHFKLTEKHITKVLVDNIRQLLEENE